MPWVNGQRCQHRVELLAKEAAHVVSLPRFQRFGITDDNTEFSLQVREVLIGLSSANGPAPSSPSN